VEHKCWPKIRYGLSANDSPYNYIVSAMNKPYYILCAVEGLVRSARREIRYLDGGFYGFDLPHRGIEAIVESLNKILTHYGSQSTLGVQYQLSVELLILELGRSDQPFLEAFEKYGTMITDCTLKNFEVTCTGSKSISS
jgi:hypothetical protein